ncbi:MAG: BadF/BadG/BcrA/BcrD ATPase family protein [Patescibacteria group bacterium]
MIYWNNMVSENQKYVIGIDGGGTKTTIALADLKGKILKTVKAGPSSPRNIGIRKTAANITEGIKKILPRKKKIEIPSVFIGLPSVEEEFESKIGEIKREFLRHRGLSLISKSRLTIGSDQLIAFWSGTDDKDGIILIAGTGCVAHGWRGKREAKASGWGWLADEGSSFWVGQKVYQAVLKSLDGRGLKTQLVKLITKKGNVVSLNKSIYSREPNETLSPFSYFCDRVAKRGDKVARDILMEAAGEQALAVSAVIRKLDFQKTKFPLVLVGSMFNSGTVSATFKKEIRKVAPRAQFIRPKREPVFGAIRLALEQL